MKNAPLKRSQITGLTIRLLKWQIEIVIVKRSLNTVAVYTDHNRKLIKRWERG